MYKHYIKIDEDNMIIDAFSSAFRQPQDGEILVADTNERHFHLDLRTTEGYLKKKWEGGKIKDIPDKDIYTLDIKKEKKKIEVIAEEREKAIKAMYEDNQEYLDKIKAIDDAVNETELDAI